MARLRTAPETIFLAMKARSEGLGIRATGRVLGKSGGSIINWEKRLSEQVINWSPPSPEGSDVTLEGDEVYTRVRESINFVSETSQGWTIHFIERTSCYWVEAQAGLKNASLFEKGVKAAWNWAKPSEWIRWFTDGERRYGNELWKLASVYLTKSETTESYGYRKVWREGLEVSIKVKVLRASLMLNGLNQNILLQPSVLNQTFTPIIMKLRIVLSDEELAVITGV